MATGAEIVFDIERGEQVEHGEPVEQTPSTKVVVQEAKGCVNEVDDELRDLQLGEMAFPLRPVARGRQSVVEVQEDVDLSKKMQQFKLKHKLK